MLSAVPRSWWASDYNLLKDSTTVAVIDSSWWRETGELTIKDSTYRVYREGFMSGAFVLESGGSVLARAEKPSAFYRSFLVEHDGRKFTLEAESAFFRKFILSEAGQQIGSVYPLHALTRKAVVDLPEELPLALRVFMFWLVAIQWKRDSDAAASG